MVAMAVLPLLHVPFKEVSERGVVAVTQRLEFPVIVPITGNECIVIDFKALSVQPELLVTE